MNFELIHASEEYKDIIRNLMQFYIYDFSEFIKCDVEEDGLFGAYPYLEDYWIETNHRFPYVIKKDDKYVGFILVRFIEAEERKYFSIAEFFIMKKYRNEGIGKSAAKQVFNFHKGQWEVYQLESNKPAQIFWNKVINEFTQGQFRDRLQNGKKIQDFASK
ncbi:GNAT family N-acetyltransferase [Paenibacillus sp. sptzw28]|uniref:GNAT family N-acetyltransferase n=1 Tax=Paenibacillus sp. sptzw28 TaxID=715179 RepID=UPI001C6E4E0F|nr:GNAT family N-acetyltransferase [Paenibacillus sp. sptzw28]QYR21939.1 GNAT family N-acetyltransferase [Paenibacillus sp. sptzw28]